MLKAVARASRVYGRVVWKRRFALRSPGELPTLAEYSVSEGVRLNILIIALLLVIFATLFSGLVFLVRDRGQSDRLMRSLGLRVGLTVLLLLILVVGFLTGRIQPRSFPLQPPPEAPGAAS